MIDAGRRLFRGVTWTLLGTLASQGLQFLRIFIIARLLTPDDFGLFGMCTLLMTALSTFLTLDFRQAFIVHQYESAAEQREWLDTVWTANVLLSMALGLGLIVAAYPASSYFHEPRLPALAIFLSVTPFLHALASPGRLASEKAISFGKPVALDAVDGVTALLATLTATLWVRSAWALVWGYAIGKVAVMLASYLLLPVRPRLRLLATPLRDSFSFGKHLMAVSILTFVTTRFDNLVIARQLESHALGLYVVAYRLGEFPAIILSSAIGQVLLPFYAEAAARNRRDLSEVATVSVRAHLWLLLLAYLPLVFFPEFVLQVAVGSQWSTAAPTLAILAIAGLCRGEVKAFSSILLALRRSDLDARCKLAEVAVLVPAALWGVSTYGLVGAATAVALAYGLALVLRFALIVKLLDHSGLKLAATMSVPVGAGLTAGMLAIAARQATHSSWLALVLLMAAMIALAYWREPVFRRLVSGLHSGRASHGA